MYQNRHFLHKSTVLTTRCHSVASRARKLVPNVIGKSNHGRLMSSKPNNINWGYSAVAGLLFGGAGATFIASRSEEFRGAIEDVVPYAKQTFSFLMDNEEGEPSTPSVNVDTPYLTLPTDEAKEKEMLVLNLMDQPVPSQIDFDVINPHSDDDTDSDDAALVVVESPLDDIVVVAEASIISAVEEPSLVDITEDLDQVLVGEKTEGTIILAEVDDISLIEDIVVDDAIHIGEEIIALVTVVEESIVQAVAEVKVIDNNIEEMDVFSDSFAETPLFNDYAVEVEDTPESLTAVLNSEYEILKIVIRDAITTKSSGAGMLQGYITQFGRALLVSKEDPAFDSIWESTAILEHAVTNSIDLVKVKEIEISSQIKSVTDLIVSLRSFGSSDIANLAEELIASATEHLHSCESEIETAKNKLNFLLGYQQRIKGSPELVQEHLEGFTPDLIKLLNIKQYKGMEELSNDDALLLFSLQRPELIYAEVQLKEEEKQKEFEALIQKQREDLAKQAELMVGSEIEKVEAHKDNVLDSKVLELNELYENNLKEELRIQSEADQQHLENTTAALKEELDSLHLSEMNSKLNEKEDEHIIVLENNLSYLNGIKSKIGDVVDVEEQQRLCQALWVAAQALNTALGTFEDGRSKSLMPEISSIMQFPDATIDAIVSSIPKAAVDSGVVPEKLLIQRFSDLKRDCKQVAMVKDENGSFLAYTLSYIKSLLVFPRFYQSGLDSDIDIEKIGPYEILEKAEYYIQKGDLVQAAKLMSQLKGVSKRLSADWLNEVRLLLETKQMADFLMAYAGSRISGFE